MTMGVTPGFWVDIAVDFDMDQKPDGINPSCVQKSTSDGRREERGERKGFVIFLLNLSALTFCPALLVPSRHFQDGSRR